jgi:dTDP-4-amino-4,6-dideoxygalactose transaminase
MTLLVNINGKNILPFWKGRIALYAILKAMGMKEEDEVILPGFTCVVVPNAIVYLGAKPVYVDIDPEIYNIDPNKIEEKITERTKAIIAQHTFGIPAEMDEILAIAKKYNLYVIEDSCHAIGSKYKGKEVGTIGDAAFFSSQWSKPVTTGLGGWAVVNNSALEERMGRIYGEFIEPGEKEVFLLRLQYLLYSRFLTPRLFWFAMDSYRWLSEKGITIGSSERSELESEKPNDYEKKMSDWQRNLLEKKLKEIDRIIEHRRWVVSSYEKYLPEIGIKPVKLPAYIEPIFLRYPILVEDKGKILQEAKRQRIELGDWFLSPLHPNFTGWEKVGYKKGMCPVAEEICNKVVNLPTHTKIDEREIQRITKFLSNHLLN